MKKTARLALLLFSALSLGACADWPSFDWPELPSLPSFSSAPSAPEPAPYGPFTQLAPSAPPMPAQEERPVNPDPVRYVWRPGHWTYSNANFDWVAGEYMLRPSPTAAWSPDRWEHRLFGWAFVPGYWQ